MPFVQTFLHHPRKLFLRWALFQVHLWAGVLLSLYVIVIALTGSILVFRSEIVRAQLPSTLTSYNPSQTASIAQVIAAVQRTYPAAHIADLTLPSSISPAFVIAAQNPDHHSFYLLADPTTATLYPRHRTWIDWTYDLHVYLLLGTAHGMQVNGIGAAILMLLCITGLVLWWPGLKLWTRGLRISLRHNWRRINFDAHSAIGFWTLLLVSWWAFSGIYFAWYKQVAAAVAIVSPIRGMAAPIAPPRPTSNQHASLEAILQAIHQAAPQGHLYSLSDPALTTPTVYALVDLRAPGDFSHRDIISLSTRDARILTDWHYGQNHTLGDWVLWAMHPIHFGTVWGTPIKILWSLLGVSLAVLTLTGLLMYWNRYLRHRL
ncbi:PepSY-associated TM helix domain-containing protein [Granulicella tundricola]|uniref:PepSY-associated TM helix domain protein n=1 Tax=Granulicella tundricola (strain ATCC BAA-1859 / DSM 23138 / MP5ACTX9) TaxID=1198114 RepID=E8X249_GRATM|nr:PepSY-associated TM helix domain-containing protein [Granulicella tundricola]ADW70292.1 PepSY-associated TM helix domain protein [Granulicella tundricola MP5ACTX9]